MTYPNAYKGVKKLFTSQILSLIATIVFFVVAILRLFSIGAADVDESVSLTLALIALIIGAIAGIIAVISYIFQIIGLKQAGNDDRNFYTAFVFAIIALVLTIVATILSSLNVANGFGDEIADVFNRFADIVIVAFVINGIKTLAEKLNQTKMAQKAKSLGIVQIVILALVVIAEVISLFTGDAASTISAILALIAAILMIIFSIMYLVILGKAKKMLAEN